MRRISDRNGSAMIESSGSGEIENRLQAHPLLVRAERDEKHIELPQLGMRKAVDALRIAPLLGRMKQQTERLALAPAQILGRLKSQPSNRGQFGRNSLPATSDLKLLADALRKIR